MNNQIILSFRSPSLDGAVSAFAIEMEAAGVCVQVERRLNPVFMAAGKRHKSPTAVLISITPLVKEGFFNAVGALGLQAILMVPLWSFVSKTSNTLTPPEARPEILVVSCDSVGGACMRFVLPSGLESAEYERPVEVMMHLLEECMSTSSEDSPEPIANQSAGRGAAYLEYSGDMGGWVPFKSSEGAEDLHRHLSDLSASPKSAWD